MPRSSELQISATVRFISVGESEIESWRSGKCMRNHPGIKMRGISGAMRISFKHEKTFLINREHVVAHHRPTPAKGGPQKRSLGPPGPPPGSPAEPGPQKCVTDISALYHRYIHLYLF